MPKSWHEITQAHSNKFKLTKPKLGHLKRNGNDRERERVRAKNELARARELLRMSALA